MFGLFNIVLGIICGFVAFAFLLRAVKIQKKGKEWTVKIIDNTTFAYGIAALAIFAYPLAIGYFIVKAVRQNMDIE